MFLGFILALPEKILLNVPGEEGEKNPHHQGVVNQTDARQSLGDEVERIDEVNKTQKPSHQGAGRPLAIATSHEVAKHGGSGPDQARKVGELGARAERIHGWSIEDGNVSTMELSFQFTIRFRKVS